MRPQPGFGFSHRAPASVVSGDNGLLPAFNPALWQDWAGSGGGATGWTFDSGTATFDIATGSWWEAETVASPTLPAGDYILTVIASAVAANAKFSLYAKTGSLSGAFLTAVALPAPGTYTHQFHVPADVTGFVIRSYGGVAMTLTGASVAIDPSPPGPPVFDPAFEFVPDPGFDNPASWSTARCVVSGSTCTTTATTSPSASCVPTATLVPGTYRCQYTVVTASRNFTCYVGGLGVNATSRTGLVTVDVQVTEETLTSQAIALVFNSGTVGAQVSDFSVKRIA